MDQQMKMRVAYHETGHAVMALRYRLPIKEVSLTRQDSYLGAMKLEQPDAKSKLDGQWAMQRIMIALSGYASEMIFLNRVEHFITEDLSKAVDLTNDMLQFDEFKNWLAGLPVPKPSPFDVIENPLIRAYVYQKMLECMGVLDSVKPAVQLIAEELFKKDTLTGAEVAELFHSIVPRPPI